MLRSLRPLTRACRLRRGIVLPHVEHGERINKNVTKEHSPGRSRSAAGCGRRTGIRGETYAYWYLRRHGYTGVARNFRSPSVKGEIDLVGYDGKVLAFVEVKTRSADDPDRPDPEQR